MGLRRSAAVVVMAALVALGVGIAGGGAASAQTTDFCQYTVTPVTLTPPGGTVTVEGTAPADANIRVFANGVLVAETRSDPVSGHFIVSFFLAQTSEITVAIDDYPATGCGIAPEQAQILREAQQAQRALPRTGASHIGSNVLVGLLLVAVGSVLVVAMRRRDTLGRKS